MNVGKTARISINIEKALRIFRDSIRNWRSSFKVAIYGSWIISLRFGSSNIAFFENNVRVFPFWGLVLVDNVDSHYERSNLV